MKSLLLKLPSTKARAHREKKIIMLGYYILFVLVLGKKPRAKGMLFKHSAMSYIPIQYINNHKLGGLHPTNLLSPVEVWHDYNAGRKQ